jgi:hypothetical protein
MPSLNLKIWLHTVKQLEKRFTVSFNIYIIFKQLSRVLRNKFVRENAADDIL